LFWNHSTGVGEVCHGLEVVRSIDTSGDLILSALSGKVRSITRISNFDWTRRAFASKVALARFALTG
jgi:hypothetical protein